MSPQAELDPRPEGQCGRIFAIALGQVQGFPDSDRAIIGLRRDRVICAALGILFVFFRFQYCIVASPHLKVPPTTITLRILAWSLGTHSDGFKQFLHLLTLAEQAPLRLHFTTVFYGAFHL